MTASDDPVQPVGRALSRSATSPPSPAAFGWEVAGRRRLIYCSAERRAVLQPHARTTAPVHSEPRYHIIKVTCDPSLERHRCFHVLTCSFVCHTCMHGIYYSVLHHTEEAKYQQNKHITLKAKLGHRWSVMMLARWMFSH